MQTGKVKFFNKEKGFGFIICHEDNKEYFVHNSGCLETITEADEVQFEITEGKKGPVASNVELV